MKVLCIFNGDQQPETLQLAKYIDNARRRKREGQLPAAVY